MHINWNGPLEWSTGQRAFRTPLSPGSRCHAVVTACQEWNDTEVAVDKTTGKILGCEHADYPYIRNVAENPPVYLHLFHGRTTPDEDMEDWGFNGPTIGPLEYVHVTYMCDIKFAFQDGHDAAKFGLEQEGHLSTIGGCVELNGRFYGDFSINAFGGGCVAVFKDRVEIENTASRLGQMLNG